MLKGLSSFSSSGLVQCMVAAPLSTLLCQRALFSAFSICCVLESRGRARRAATRYMGDDALGPHAKLHTVGRDSLSEYGQDRTHQQFGAMLGQAQVSKQIGTVDVANAHPNFGAR